MTRWMRLLVALASLAACRDRDGAPASPPAPAPAGGALPAYTGPVGTVEGTIFVWDDDGHHGAHVQNDAVVAITGYEGFYIPEPAPAKRIVFEHGAFPMRTVTMTFGQRLEIVNDSNTVLAPSFDQVKAAALMVAPPRAGLGASDPISLHPPHPGYFTLRDRIGSDPARLDVYVLLHPLHTVSAAGGRYRIEGVPAGATTVHARVAGVGEASAAVRVRPDLANAPGVVQTADLYLEYRAPATGGVSSLAAKSASSRIVP